MYTHHKLTVLVLFTQTCFEDVQTNSTNTSVHKHMLSDDAIPPPPTSTIIVESKLDPHFPEGGETEAQKEISGPPDVHIIYTPTSTSFSFSGHPFPQFQAANSAVCQLHLRSCNCTCKHSIHLYLLWSSSATWPVCLYTPITCKVTQEKFSDKL